MRVNKSHRIIAHLNAVVPEIWSLHNGYMRLFLVGPGMGEWWPLTSPDSSVKKHGSAMELEISRQVVQYLNLHHPQRGAEFSYIRKVLDAHGWQPDEFTRYPTDERSKPSENEEEEEPQAPEPNEQ